MPQPDHRPRHGKPDQLVIGFAPAQLFDERGQEEGAPFAVILHLLRGEEEFIGDADPTAERDAEATLLARLADSRLLRRLRALLSAPGQGKPARCRDDRHLAYGVEASSEMSDITRNHSAAARRPTQASSVQPFSL